ncbi:MAG: glycosyltransferase [Coleofasciculus sp. B1-GNL1-01]|uniref:glycosyltransferase n=1 Tax=Coleofasciculus sp. B1-GNL1-01 TaxID=3068484 RepID=UPI0033036567
MNPIISVILPVYNGEKTIKETVRSVLSQTFSEFELIIINDGSADSTVDIVSSIEDERIQVFSYPNAGQPASRNRGIAKAQGDYIAFIDADDLWTADKLEAQYKALQDNPQAALAYSWTDWIDESGELLKRGSYITESGDVLSKLLLNDFVANGSNPLIRRQALLEVGGFDESLSNAHDWDMWLRLAVRYPFVAVASPQVLYRKSTSSMSANIWGMERSSIQVIEKALNQAPASLQNLKPGILGNRYKYLTYRALEWPLERKKGFAALKFLTTAIRYDPSLLLRFKLIVIVLTKIGMAILIPSHLSRGAKMKIGG